LAKKKTRDIYYFAMLSSEFESMKRFLDDDIPVYLTFLDKVNYKDDKMEKRVMIKTAFEKVGG